MTGVTEVWTDGASTGKRGPGGWAYLVQTPEEVYWESGGIEDGTTNSRMEMEAVILALASLPPSHVKVYCDSAMVVNGVKRGWVEMWRNKARPWTNSRKEPVVNRDLWEDLDTAIGRHKSVEMIKVKAHTRSPSRKAIGNRRVDVLAHKACQRAKKAGVRVG